jgi:heat shock protein HtpX
MPPTPRNIYEQQGQNRRLTILVLVLFVLFVGFLGFGVDLFLFGPPLTDDGTMALPIPFATLAAVAIASLGAVRSAMHGDAAVLASATATPVPEENPRYRPLLNVVEEMSIAAGLPRPKIYIVPDPDPNAFATGRDPAHASIAVTEGLVERLNRDELQGVIAHEMSHIRNEDIRLMTVVASLIGAVMLIAEFGTRMFRFGGAKGSRRNSRSGGGPVLLILFILWIIAMVLAPFIANLLAMAVSRQREYLADASGAELTRNPGGLASALEKIAAADDPTRLIKKGTAHLCIADPLGREANKHEGLLADLFGTHPPVERRISLLKTMAYQPS